MRSVRWALLMTLAVVWTGASGPVSGAEREAGGKRPSVPADPHSLAALSGPALVQQLLDPGTRSTAFYKLWRRTHRGDDTGYDNFLEDHYDPEVVVCPQESNRPPIYAVLYGSLSREDFSVREEYEIPNPQELFPPLDGQGRQLSWDEPAIEFFTADGKRITPFGGNNLLREQGVMADVNGDGFIERVDRESYAVGGVRNADVLEISVVKSEPQPLLSVLYNWGDDDEWDYRLGDPGKDGLPRLELGPKTPDGIKTKVVYEWDKDRKAYAGPAGGQGDHFRRLNAAEPDVFKEFKRLGKAGLVFPKDPDFIDARSATDDPWVRWGRRKPSLKDLSKPYRRDSLKLLSNEDVVRFMGEGRNFSELEWQSVITNHVPANFWTLDPKSAALALVDEHRYPDHRARFRLAVDDRDGQKPPGVCSLAFTYISDRSYSAEDRHFFLRVDPKKSYLAHAGSAAGGIVFYNFVHDQPAFDFRYCEMTYDEARHLADTIWWLNRVRSLCRGSFEDASMMSTTADGSASVVFRGEDGKAALRWNETLWAGHVAERWRGDYSPEVFVNLAAFLIWDAWTAHLGERWTRFEPRQPRGSLDPESTPPRYEPHEMENLKQLTATFLDLYSPDQTAVSFAIVREAAGAAGGFAWAGLSDRLSDIRARLPVVEGPRRTEEQIEAELRRLEALQPGDKGWKEAQKRQNALYWERMSLYHDTGVDDVRALGGAIDLSLKKIRCAGHPDALQAWAASKEEGFAWALQRLKIEDGKRYVAALEWWLKNTQEKWARQAFDSIAREDSARAVEIAKGVPPDRKGDLTVSAFSHLGEVDGIPDEQKRVKALIRVALDPKSGWEERGRAIDLLVPPGQPMRYPSRDVDDALVELLSPKRADEVLNFTLARACRGLALRKRTECFDRIAAALKTADDGMIYSGVLGALVQLVQCDPAKFNSRLQAILKPQLERTNKMVTDLLMAAWSADLRDLRPDLERLATSDPDDYEDERAHSYGGEERAFEGRFHLARKILSLWDEEDPPTRCRLLLAFGLHQAAEFGEEPAPERRARMEAELASASRVLTTKQREDAASFLAWYQKEHIDKEEQAVYRECRAKFIALARDRLGLKQEAKP